MKVRSSHQMCSIKIVALKNFTKLTGKHLCLSLFINKVAGLRPAILLKKTLWYRCFPVNFAKFLSKLFLQNTSGRVLLEILQLVHEIRSFPEVLYKRGVLKNFSKFTDKHKKQSSGGVLSKNVLENFAKFTGKYLCRSLSFNKVAGWKLETWNCQKLCHRLFLIKLQLWGPAVLLRRLQHRCFPVKFANFLRINYFESVKVYF